MLRSIFLVLLCAAGLVAPPAQAVIFNGHDFQPVGLAQLTILPGPPPSLEAALTEAGDGFSLAVGPGGGGVRILALPDPSTLPDGSFLRMESRGDVAGALDQVIATVDLDVVEGRVSVRADFPALGSPSVRAEVYVDGSLTQVISPFTSYDASAFPVVFESRRHLVAAEPLSAHCSDSALGTRSAGVVLRFPAQAPPGGNVAKTEDVSDVVLVLLALAGGGDPELTQKLLYVIVRENPIGVFSVLTGLESESRVSDTGISTLGPAILEQGSQGLSVKQLAGCHAGGVRARVDAHVTKSDVEIEELILKKSGASCIDIDIRGDTGGGDQVLASGHVEVIGSTVELSADFSPMGVGDRAFYYHQDQLIAVPPPGNPNRALEPIPPQRIGGFYADQFNLGFRFRWNAPITFEAPFGGTLIVDEVRVVADAPTPPYQPSAMDLYFGSPGDTDDVHIVEDGATGVRADPGFAFTHMTALGRSYVQRGGGEVVLVRKAGDGGVHIALSGEPDPVRIEFTGDLGVNAPQTVKKLDFQALIRPLGLPPRPMGTLELSKSFEQTTIAADFTSVSSQTATVQVLLEGGVVAHFPGMEMGVMAIGGPNFPTPCSVVVQSFGMSQAPLGYALRFREADTISITYNDLINDAKAVVLGDEIRILAENPIRTLDGVLEFTLVPEGIESLLITRVAADLVTATTPSVVVRGPALRVVPNPFNPRTSVRFDLPRPSDVVLQVFSVDGRLVDTLHGGWLSAGPHVVEWAGFDQRGHSVASGTYLVRLQSLEGKATARMTLLK